METSHFSQSYFYPNRKNPRIVVDSIKDGYYFEFPNASDENFVLSSSEVHDLSNNKYDLTPTKAEGLHLFRQFGKDKWPELFK